MFNRENLFRFLINAALVAAAVLGARYGIPIPPPQVTIPPADPMPAAPANPAPAKPAPNPLGAIGRIQFGNAGCSATVIGERRDDGRYLVLTAAHCVRGQPRAGTMRMRDGRTLAISVARVNDRADCCWCFTDATPETLPFALLAPSTPPVGTRIWHAGYGVDVPGNREDGTLDAPANSDGQVRMTLSVSSGDSGGGICTDDAGRVVSCVCCTSARGQRAQVWGASPESIAASQPAAPVWDVWTPLDVPLKMEP